MILQRSLCFICQMILFKSTLLLQIILTSKVYSDENFKIEEGHQAWQLLKILCEID